MAETKQYTIQVNVVGDKQLLAFQKSIDKVSKSARTSSTALTKMDKRMTAMANTARRLAPVVASIFTTQAINNVIAYGDAIGKTADKVGLSTEELQKLNYAAELSGVSAQTANMAWQRFARRAGEAAKGTGELAKVFDELGISTTDIDGNLKSTQELLFEFADAIGEAEGQSAKLALAFKGFDSEGAALVNLFGEGSDKAKEFGEELERLGGVLSDDLVRGAEELNDELTKFGAVIKAVFSKAILNTILSFRSGFAAFVEDLKAGEDAATVFALALASIATAITVRVVPAMLALAASNPFIALGTAAAAAAVYIIANWEKVANFFRHGLPAAIEYLKGVFFVVFDAIAQKVGQVVEFITDKLAVAVQAMADAAAAINENPIGDFVVPDEAVQTLELIAQKLDETGEAWEGFGTSAQQAFEKSKQHTEDWAKATEEAAKSTDDAAKAQEELNKKLNAGGPALQKQGEEADKAAKALDRYKESVLGVQQELDLLPQKIELLIQLFKEGAISSDVFQAELRKLSEASKEAATWQEEFADSLKETQAEADKAAEKIAIVNKMLEEGAISAETAADALRQLGVTVKETQGIFENFGNEVVEILEGQVVNAAKEMVSVLWDSEADIGDIVSSMIKNFAKLVAEMLAAKAAALALNAVLGALGLGGGGGGGIGGGGGGFGSLLGGIAGTAIGGPVGGIIGGALGSLLPFARGGVVPAGIAGSGFITHGPMKIGNGWGPLHPAARGMVIGEQGAEAVLPLSRTASGALGVSTSGGAISISVNNYAGVDVQVENKARVDGGRDISFMINDAVKKEFKRGGYDRAMRGNFNMKRRGL